MTIVEIERAIEMAGRLQRRLIEAAMRTETPTRAARLDAAHTLFEALALAMGRNVKETEVA